MNFPEMPANDNESLRIMQVITRNELRGAEVFASNLSEELARRGHSICMPAIYQTDDAAFDIPGVEHIELNGSTKGKIEWKALCNLRHAIRKFQPDAIQANGFHALKYAVLSRAMAHDSSPIVYRNISLAENWIRGRLRRSWGKWLFRRVAFVTSVSEQCATNLCRTYDFPTERTMVIRRGITKPQLDRSAARTELLERIDRTDSPERQLLMHIGGFTQEKNQLGLLKVFKKLQNNRAHCLLVLCGDGPLLPEAMAKAESLGLTNSVFFLGRTPDAADLVGGADLFVLSSKIEGIPGVVLEAAIRGVPSVCFDVGGINEAVIDGETGRLIPAMDYSALQHAIETLLDNDDTRLKLGCSARQFIAKHHMLENAVEKLLGVYRECQQSAQ